MCGIIYNKNKAELFGKIREKYYLNRNNRSRLAGSTQKAFGELLLIRGVVCTLEETVPLVKVYTLG